MKLNWYSIFDAKARCYSQPFLSYNDEVALRSFVALANDTQSQVGAFSDDFTLYRIGFFDDQVGHIEAELPVHNLGCAASFKNQNPE